MSLVKKYFISNFTCKTVSACSYLFNGPRINCALYYTSFNNSGNGKPTTYNYPKLGEPKGRTISSVTLEKGTDLMEKSKNALTNFLNYFRTSARKNKLIGYLWYQTLDDIDVQEFFTLFKMEDSFYSRFQIMELHTWMILCHLPKTDRGSRFVRTGLIEAFWKDTGSRAKIISEKRLSKKDYWSFYDKFLFSLIQYDCSFKSSDVNLGNALWLSFFSRQNVDPRHLEALIRYTRCQMHHLSQINFEQLKPMEKKPKIWTPVQPHVEKVFREL